MLFQFSYTYRYLCLTKNLKILAAVPSTDILGWLATRMKIMFYVEMNVLAVVVVVSVGTPNTEKYKSYSCTTINKTKLKTNINKTKIEKFILARIVWSFGDCGNRCAGVVCVTGAIREELRFRCTMA